MKAIIDKEQCMGCGNCIPFCPKHLLSLSSNLNYRNVFYTQVMDLESCIGCGICEQMCTAGAIRMDVPKKNGYALIDKEKIPPHSGCYLGSLTKALSDAIVKLHVEKNIVIFKQEASDVNLKVDTIDFQDDSYFDKGILYQKEHPEKMVILICSSSKEQNTLQNEKRFRNLKSCNITILHTSDWFETDSFCNKPNRGGTNILEELKENKEVYFAARTSASNPKKMHDLQSYIEKALLYQNNKKGVNIVELIYPCYYRLAGRPKQLMSAGDVGIIRSWFEKDVLPLYKEGVIVDRGNDDEFFKSNK